MHDSVRDLVMRKLCLQPCLAVWEFDMLHVHCTLLQCSAMQFVCYAVCESDVDAVSMHDASLFSRCYVWVVGLMLTLRVWVMQVHTAIREDPAPQKKERSKPSETKLWKAKKLTYDERKQKLKVPLLLSLLLSVLPSALPMLLLPTTSPQCRSAFLFSLDVSV